MKLTYQIFVVQVNIIIVRIFTPRIGYSTIRSWNPKFQTPLLGSLTENCYAYTINKSERRLINAVNTNRCACHTVHTTGRQLTVTLCSMFFQGRHLPGWSLKFMLYWFNVGPLFSTSAHHWSNTCLMSCICRAHTGRPGTHEALTQCGLKIGPASLTLFFLPVF